MKKIDELMEELGFNKDSPKETGKAFIKNLIKQANEQNPPSQIEQASVRRLDVHMHKKDLKQKIDELKKVQEKEEQLSFDLKIS